MPKMRTIKEAIRSIKESDPGTAITEHALRGMVNAGQIKHIRAGRKILLDLDYLNEYLRGERDTTHQAATTLPLTPKHARIITAKRECSTARRGNGS